MMTSTKELAKKTYELVILGFPLSENIFEEDLKEIEGEIFRNHLKQFRSSLEDALQLASTPFQLTSKIEQSLTFQRFHISERIRSLGHVDPEKTLSDELEARALESAKVKMQDYLEGDRSREKEFLISVMNRIVSEAESQNWVRLERNLRLQALVVAWGALEVCLKDSLISLVNSNPRFIEDLSEGKLKRQIGTAGLSLQDLSRYGYDVRNSLGCIMLGHLDFSNISFVKSALESLFSEMKPLMCALKEESIYSLACKRHLIVHRRGIVDEKFVSETSTSQKVGDELVVSSRVFEDTLKHLWKFGYLLVEAADEKAKDN